MSSDWTIKTNHTCQVSLRWVLLDLVVLEWPVYSRSVCKCISIKTTLPSITRCGTFFDGQSCVLLKLKRSYCGTEAVEGLQCIAKDKVLEIIG